MWLKLLEPKIDAPFYGNGENSSLNAEQVCVFLLQRNVLQSRWTFRCHHIRHSFSLRHTETLFSLHLNATANMVAWWMDVESLWLLSKHNECLFMPSLFTERHPDRKCKQVLFVSGCAMVTSSEREGEDCIKCGATAGTSVCLLPRRATSAFLCVRACWERNPNYRLPLADEGPRCLRCTEKRRKRKIKPFSHPCHARRQPGRQTGGLAVPGLRGLTQKCLILLTPWRGSQQ